MRTKRIFLTLSSAFLLFGATMNIMNAINNYGLATNSLHSEILAQTNGDDGTPTTPGNGDNTGGGSTTGGGNTGTGTNTGSGTSTGTNEPNSKYYLKDNKLVHEDEVHLVMTDYYGVIHYKDYTAKGDGPFLPYTVFVDKNDCIESSGDYCDVRMAVTRYTALKGNFSYAN